jgi:hypothetical protein
VSYHIREGLVEGLAEVVGPAHPSVHFVCLVPRLRRESSSSAADSADPSPLEVAQERVQVQGVRDGVCDVGEGIRYIRDIIIIIKILNTWLQ